MDSIFLRTETNLLMTLYGQHNDLGYTKKVLNHGISQQTSYRVLKSGKD